MVGCSAYNCANNSSKGFRLFRFPADVERRAKWVQNCRRDKWTPSDGSRLCEIHFEETQWETKRIDGRKKLKQSAIPTLFSIPNPPKPLSQTRRSKYKVWPTNADASPRIDNFLSSTDTQSIEIECTPSVDEDVLLTSAVSSESMQHNSEMAINGGEEVISRSALPTTAQIATVEAEKENIRLRLEVASLKNQFETLEGNLKKFLTDGQIKALQSGSAPRKWDTESIVLGCKLRFSLGVHGYNYLRNTNYPIPSYSTLVKRLQNFEVNFGVFSDLHEPLLHKVATLNSANKMCIVCVDEMEINGNIEFLKHKQSFCGNVTLGSPDAEGNHLTVVLVRGVHDNWKQVIACEVTGPSTEGHLMRDLIEKSLNFCESCGLHVLGICSDMGSNNRAMWRSFGVRVTKQERQIKFVYNGRDIHVVPDVCHLLKNLKSAVLRTGLKLPEDIVNEEELPTCSVQGQYIVQLWIREVEKKKGLRFLHHLRKQDVLPDHYGSMNVGSAVRFFSIKTAAGLEVAVSLGALPREALTTAFFCRLVHKWFSICSSKISKASITRRNKHLRIACLLKFAETFQNVTIGNGWKPLNTGIILSTLSLCEIAEKLLSDEYKFVLLHRFTQDAIENIFSQVRRRAGSCPSAADCLKALKLICTSQFLSDIKRSSYMSDSDQFLIDYFNQSNVCDPAHEVAETIVPEHELPEESFTTLEVNRCQLSTWDQNNIYNIGGSTTRALLKKKALCDMCKSFLRREPDEESADMLVSRLDQGGLMTPAKEVMKLLCNSEHLFRQHRNILLSTSSTKLVEKIVQDISVDMPLCCNLKKRIVNHYFTVRSYCEVDYLKNSKKRKQSYGSASEKRKKN